MSNFLPASIGLLKNKCPFFPYRFLIPAILLLSFSIKGFCEEPVSMRLDTGWEFYRGDLGSTWEALRTGRSAALPSWQKVTLPHCFNAFDAVDPDVEYYEGPGWYRTFLKVENPYENGRTLLHFEGAGQKTRVYIAEFPAGEHTGGYDEFTVDLTEALKQYYKKYTSGQFDGQVPILIRVDNSRDTEMIPSDLSDFNIYGGIYRYLNLLYMPRLFVSQVHVSPRYIPEKDRAILQVKVSLNNPDQLRTEVGLRMNILSPANEILYSRDLTHRLEGNDGTATFQFTMDTPDLWYPASPSLYACSIEYGIGAESCSETVKFGIRYFEFRKQGPFKLNGERLLLRGTHRHEDHAGVGAAMTEEMIRHEMLMMKEMGVNFIRLGHYQQSRIVLDLCDELGILVWEEIPWCRGGLGGEGYQEQARHMLSNMINQHYNHPSVIIWGLGNENDWPGDFEEFDQEKIRAFMVELNDLAHRLDPSRKTAIRRCDFCSDIVDVYSPSIWAGWYRGKYTDYLEASRAEMEKVDHFFHAEWGASHHAGRHSEDPDQGLKPIASTGAADEREGDFLPSGGEPRVSRDGDWTESYAVNLVDWHLKEQEKMDWLTGSAYWPFKDFSTPLRPENPVPYVNQKGVAERDLRPKETYYVFQSYWTDEPMIRIYGHSWYTRWGKENGRNMVKVYSNCPSAELFLNGESQGIRTRDSQNFPAAGLRWIVRFREGENNLKTVAEKDGIHVEDQVTVNYQTREWGTPARFILEEVDRKGDTSCLRAIVLDPNGVLCLDAKNLVTFGCTGEGRLIDNLGTAAGSRKVQMSNGRAFIRVKLNGGPSVASVSADSIPAVFCVLSPSPIPGDPVLLHTPVTATIALPAKKKVLQEMTRVCDWQLDNMPQPGEHPYHYRTWDWTNASLFTGIMALYRSGGKKKYPKTLEGFASSTGWSCGPRFRHADDLCIGQTWLELNEINPAPYKIEKVRARVDSLMADPKPGRVDWWWCDALFMSPPVLARLASATGSRKYLDYMNGMWWDANEFLYDPEESLYYRDDRYRIKADGSGRRESDGQKVFWSRGNGWVMAGTARVLQYMPEDYPDRERYLELFRQMAGKIIRLQGYDGLWKSSMYYPQGYPHGETSGSGFFCYALAWGINNGILDRDTYLPAVLLAWKGLTNAVQPSGKLGWVQQIGHAPAEINEHMSEVYGVGAFLLAGSEVMKLR